ncbi:hypothetical protein [Streptomyces sp. NPDC059957]
MTARVHVDCCCPDTAVGQRPAKVGTFLERVVEDMMESADHWRAFLA